MINYFYIKFRVYQNRSEQKLMGKKKYTNISNILEGPFTALLNWYQIFVSSFMHNQQKKITKLYISTFTPILSQKTYIISL